MKLYLQNHSYRYAAEQMLLTLFPGERPEYAREAEGADVVLALSRGACWVTATARLNYGGKQFIKRTRVSAAALTGGLADDRALQKILKLAFYLAGVEALGQEPPWGALTGVRPVKIPTRAMLAGKTRREAYRQLTGVYRVSPRRAELAMDCAQASLEAIGSLASDEVSLYVGIPFCPTRCAYCSFVSADVGRSMGMLEPFLEALYLEIAAVGNKLRRDGKFVRTLYIGGGTPTTLSARQLAGLMGEIRAKIDLSRCGEYTVEAGRPDTITREKLAAIAAGGADRVSVNPQTMEPSVLAAIGRAHTPKQILQAYELAKASGIPAVNMDLIAGLPTDTPGGFQASLDQVLALAPENITVHTLALKKGARLMEEGQGLPTAGQVAQMLEYAWDTLAASGYRPYYLYRQKFMSGSFENVGWAKPGFESLYNICMMEELHSILALGGGGVSKLVDLRTGRIDRLANPKYPKEYIAAIDHIITQKEALTWPTI